MSVAASITRPRLEGRRLLVTGASSGIGRSIATAAAEEGASIALLSRSEDALADLASVLPGDHVAVPCDVADLAAAGAAVDRAAEALGGLDGVVNSAGLVRPEHVLDADPEGWRAMFDVNVLGLLAVTQAAVPHLRDHEPADVVMVSSMSGRRRTSTMMSVYAASKHAVHVLGDGLREECKPLGIRVLTLSPGFVATPIFEHDEHETRHSSDLDGTAHEVGLDPTDVAAQVVHALAQPADVQLLEIAMTSMEQ